MSAGAHAGGRGAAAGILARVAVLSLSGCAAPPYSGEPVVDRSETMAFLAAGLRPETLLFPPYLLTEPFELDQHGRIPETGLVGAGMKSDLDLPAVHRQFAGTLALAGWRVDRLETGRQAFRMLASLRGETLEIRAVRGSGATRIFVLYQPLREPPFDS